MTPQSSLALLVVSGDSLVAGSLESLLLLACPGARVVRVPTVAAGIAAQVSARSDAILVDLAITESSELVDLTRPIGHDAPAVLGVLRQDCPLRMSEALGAGAQECLLLGDLTPERLCRSLRQGLERQRLQRRLADMALRDELTGLYNRRGFFVLSEHQRRQCLRSGHSLVVVQADIDGLKAINDTLGHQAGDQAISSAAAILRCTFRESDIVARLGGDEFAAVAVDAGEPTARRVAARLEQAVRDHNLTAGLPFHLSLSVGTSVLPPASRITLQELLAEADRALYVQKHRPERPPWMPEALARVIVGRRIRQSAAA